MGTEGAVRTTRYLIGIALLAGTSLAGLTSPYGVGISPDSVQYLEAAEHVSKGLGATLYRDDGILVSLTDYPPLFPVAISLIASLTDLSPLSAVRALHVVVFASNTLLAGLLGGRLTGNSYAAILTAILFGVSPAMTETHGMLWSEPLFTTFFLILCFTLPRSDASAVRVGTAALVCALGVLTRYIGAASVLGGAAFLMIRGTGSLTRRTVYSALFGLIGLLPALGWVWFGRATYGASTGRTLSFHPLTFDRAWAGAHTVAQWISPLQRPAAWWTILVVLGALGAFLVFWKRVRSDRSGYVMHAVVQVVTYLGTLVVSITLFDAETPLDNRILSPLFPLFACAVSSTLVMAVPKRIAPLAAGAVLVLSLLRSPHLLTREWHRSLRYASPVWRSSPITELLKTLKPEVVVYSNGPDFIRSVVGHRSYSLPYRLAPRTRIVNEAFDEEMRRISAALKNHKAFVIYFRRITWRWHLPSEEELIRDLDLRKVFESGDGAVYVARVAPDENREGPAAPPATEGGEVGQQIP